MLRAESERYDDELTSGGRRNDNNKRTSRMMAGTGGRRAVQRQDGDARRQDVEGDDRNATSGQRRVTSR